MYNVVLINLTPDARAVATPAHVELRDVNSAALQTLLRDFCEIDPIENAPGETEIRVNVRHEKYLLRTEQKKLILYDVNHRELPAQRLTVEQAMVELDGTAAAARSEAILHARGEAGGPAVPGPVPPVTAPPPVSSKPRVVTLAVTAALLLGAIVYVAAPVSPAGASPEIVPLPTAEAGQVQARLEGVYLTGNEPGHHGIVVTGPGELKLFEMGAIEAPRVVYAAYRPGRIDGKLSLATDQPGGAIEVLADGNLAYCGEIYQRIP